MGAEMERRLAEPLDVGETPGRGCDDPEIVRHAQADSAAFTTLFDCFWELIYRYCYGRLRSWADAEDAAQTAFVQAVTHLPAFEHRAGAGGFRSWLLKVAHNETASIVRSAVRRRNVPFPEADLTDRAPGPEEIALDLADNDWLADLCAQLPKSQREVIELRIAGLTTKEIAQALGKSEPAVRKSTERARERLQQLRGEEAAVGHE
jgi:RNA polymerase sigma-70 factor, ECF subfamily